MVACYAPDVEFSDPVFPRLRGEEARAMWRMPVERGQDLRVMGMKGRLLGWLPPVPAGT
jgi:hypothetical protein